MDNGKQKQNEKERKKAGNLKREREEKEEKKKRKMDEMEWIIFLFFFPLFIVVPCFVLALFLSFFLFLLREWEQKRKDDDKHGNKIGSFLQIT